MDNIKFLEEKANYIRKNVVDICLKNKAGHIAPSLSCVDILTALYYQIMNISKSNWENRDRLVFSKSHGCYGLYSILADKKLIPKDYWKNFYDGSPLSGCAERAEEHGIEAGCGSLGHGFPMAVGIAFGAKLQNKTYKTYCIAGDGEMQEGTMWEAAQFAVKHNLSDFTLIIDNNSLQAMDFLENILTPLNINNDLEKKLTAFGFEVISCNGHNMQELLSSFNGFKDNTKPSALIAHTIKGYGLKCMENIPKFHFRLPTEEELKLGNRYE